MPSAQSGRDYLDSALVYERSGLWDKVQAQLEQAKRAATTKGDVHLELEVDLGFARLAGRRGQRDDAAREATQVYERAVKTEYADIAAQAKNILGAVAELTGDWERATAHFMDALSLDGVSPRTRGKVFQNLGAVAAQRKDFPKAREWFRQSVEEWRSVGYGVGLALAVTNLAAATLDSDDAKQGAALALEGVQLAREENALDVLGIALENRADALFRLGRRADALDTLAEALGLFSNAHDNLRMAQCLELFGAMYVTSEPATAESAWRKALRIAEKVEADWLVERLNTRIAGLQAS
jgi:tetratricopeptide (TPR) repeat protein